MSHRKAVFKGLVIRDKLLAGRNAPDKVSQQVPLFFGGLGWVQ